MWRWSFIDIEKVNYITLIIQHILPSSENSVVSNSEHGRSQTKVDEQEEYEIYHKEEKWEIRDGESGWAHITFDWKRKFSIEIVDLRLCNFRWDFNEGIHFTGASTVYDIPFDKLTDSDGNTVTPRYLQIKQNQEMAPLTLTLQNLLWTVGQRNRN